MKAVIIGCNGYIGKHLSDFLIRKGWEISGFDVHDTPKITMHQYAPINAADASEWHADESKLTLFDSDADFIFYFSGISGTIRGFTDYEKFIDVNEKGLLHLLEYLKKSNSKARVIFPSTRLIYKGQTNTPLDEDAEKEFKTIYALNKWFGEQVLQQYSQYFGIEHTIFRICVPYGNLFPGEYSYGTVGFFLDRVKRNQDIILYGSGEQKRTFTHIGDVCGQIYNALRCEQSRNTIFNIPGETFSLKEIAEMIAGRANKNVLHIEWPELDEKAESGDTIFDAAKLMKVSNIPMLFTFKAWLESVNERESK